MIAPHDVTAFPAIDAELQELRAGAQRWVRLPILAKVALLKDCRDGVYAIRRRWAEAAVEAKGLRGTGLEGEEWISGPWAVLYALNRYIASLEGIAKGGAPELPGSRIYARPDGQSVAKVFPNTPYDRLLLNGIDAEIWMEPGLAPSEIPATMATWYREEHPQPRVALVLGAGNIAAIPPLDVLYKLLADGAVCMLKMNPVNDYLGAIFERAFAPLVDEGYLRFAYGGPEIGQYLCASDAIDEIHITGSDATHDAIVFGLGEEGAARKRAGKALLQKPITSELGNVSPTIVVPGEWSAADFRFQAENIVTQKLHNNGFNCIASQVLVLPQDWAGTPRLVAAIEGLLRELPDRPAYYPGAGSRCERLSQVGESVALGRSGDGYTARTIRRAEHTDPDDPAFNVEAFSSFLAYVTIPGETERYLNDAVAFANERLRGTLGANMIVHPASERAHAAAIDRAIAGLRYGCIAVNAWTGVGFLLTESTWGAFPGHTLADVGSGIGVVHNSFFFSRPQKSVVRAPFAPFPRSLFGYGATLLPKPPWFVTNRTGASIGPALCDFEYRPSPLRALRVALLAMRG